MTTPIDIARDYCRRGWAVLPVPHKSKAPRITGWTDLRLTEDELAAHFNGRPMNVGILLGEPSGGLVDVDLDHPAAVRLAGEYLPATDAIFGRVGNPSSHRLYRVRGEVRTTKHKLSTGAMLVELRATGCQTVAPGSTHPTGERIEWEPDGEPAEVEVNDLLQAVKALADAVRRELGEPVEVDKAKRTTTPKPTTTGTPDAYARTALRREAEAVAGAGAGGRNDALNKAAFALGTLVGAGLLHEQDAVSALTDAAATCGLTADDGEQAVRATIRSGIAAGKREPRQIPDHTTRAATMPGGDIATGDGDADLRERARLLTDVGNAARFALQHRDRLRWCGAWQCWLIWTGTRWARDEADAATKAAIQTAIGILSEAANATSDEQRQRIADHGAKSQRRERLSAMMALAHSDMSVTPADLDADGWLLNVTNGTLDLRTGELRPHDPADLITKLAPVEYDADADCPRWRSFIARTFAEDDGLIDYVQRWCGHCLTGDIREQVLPVAYGTGNNGKSKLLEAVAAVMGDYATTASADLFTETQVGGNEARYELAELHGARLVVASETERGRRLRVALIKTLTGDRSLTGARSRRC